MNVRYTALLGGCQEKFKKQTWEGLRVCRWFVRKQHKSIRAPLEVYNLQKFSDSQERRQADYGNIIIILIGAQLEHRVRSSFGSPISVTFGL